MSTPTTFPIMGRKASHPQGCDIPDCTIPWAMIASHEQQAMYNHSQTLERLAERGGLGYSEAIAVLEDRPWEGMESGPAIMQLADMVTKWKLGHAQAKEAKPLTCPFCGHSRVVAATVHNTGGNVRYMHCATCSASGPWAKNEQEAKLRFANGLTLLHAEATAAENTRLHEDYERLQTQLKLCEQHASTMARDFDASLLVVQQERDKLKQSVQSLESALSGIDIA